MTKPIECQKLTKVYRSAKSMPALCTFDLEIERGEVFGLIGHNGAGKTTTLNLLAGLLKPSSGKARIHGFQPGSREARKLLAYLPDHPGFPAPWLRPVALIELAAHLMEVDTWKKADSLALLDLVDLREHRKRVSTFSRGMLRKLALALTLVGDPQVVLLDEPTSDLDPDARLKVREILRELARQGKSVLLSSHILSELESACDRVAFIRSGKLLAVHNITEKLDGCVRIKHRSMNGTITEDVVPETEKNMHLQALLANGATIERVEPAGADLEGWFQRYMADPPSEPLGDR